MADTNATETNTEKLQRQLGEIEDAIHAVLVGGQSYKIGSRAMTRADLNQLYTMQKQIKGQLAAEQRSSLMDDTYVAQFDRR